MTDWRTPPEEGLRDVAGLWVRVGKMEDAVVAVVSDAQRDPVFKLLAALVTMLASLQRRVLRDERWNRRLVRKREMLGSEALRMNMVDLLGGVGALERWQERARGRLALASSRQADGSRLRGNDEEGELEKKDTRASHTPSSPRRRGSSACNRKTTGPSEFALARLPGIETTRRRWGGPRSPARYETPIPVWPCEVMPERFAREWWEARRRRHKPSRHKFPENGGAIYPGPPTEEPKGNVADVGGPAACTARSSPGAIV